MAVPLLTEEKLKKTEICVCKKCELCFKNKEKECSMCEIAEDNRKNCKNNCRTRLI